MVTARTDGVPAAMAAFSSQVKAPDAPPSVGTHLGAPTNLAGMFENIAMGVLDKAATAALAAFIMKITYDLANYSTSAQSAAVTYTAADAAATLEVASSGLKLVQQGMALAKKVEALGKQPEKPEDKTGEKTGDGQTPKSANDPGDAVPQDTV